MITDELIKALQQAAEALSLSTDNIELEHPADESFGDWSSNLALQQAKQTDSFNNPRELAEALVGELEKILADNQDVEEITVAGAGFINFKLSQQYWLDQLSSLVNQKTQLISQSGKGKQVIVEYSSPNIAKPFTIGHLRSTIIGDALANIFEALGWQVHRDNHLGDWGTQFGKLIYAIKTWGDQEKINSSEQPIKELVRLYVKFHEEAEKNPELDQAGRDWFKKLENGNEEARKLWQWCIELSWQEFNQIYRELDVEFTENDGRGYGESHFEDLMPEVIEILKEKLPESQATANGGYFGQGENGAWLVFFNNDELPPLMILKQDGATLYSTRDLATDYFRLKHYGEPDLVINEVGAEQSLYFKQLYRIETMLGWYQPEQRVHVRHGLYRFADKKMSTRKGNVIWLSEVIKEAKERALELAKGNQPTADLVAIGALKWNDLRSESNRDIVFVWDELLNMKGNSGPYVQYAAVRAQSVRDKAKNQASSLPEQDLNEDELSVIRWLARFSEAVEQAAIDYASHHLAAFLFELAQRFNTFYNRQPIINAETPEQQQIRLAITAATREILTQGLMLLGIKTPEEM